MAYTNYNSGGFFNRVSTKNGTDGSSNAMAFYIVNLLTGSQIAIRIIPEEVSDSTSSQWEEVVPRGRSNPIYGYSSSGPRTVSYTIQLHDDYLPDGILTTVNQLRALTYPAYSGGSISPPKCLVRVGGNIKFTGICKEVSVTWQKPLRDGYYINAEVSLTFDEVCNTAKGSSEVAQGDFNQ